MDKNLIFMEFGYFVIFFGVFCFIVSLIVGKFGMLEPNNPNCPSDIKDTKINKIGRKILTFIGPTLVIIGLILVLFF